MKTILYNLQLSDIDSEGTFLLSKDSNLLSNFASTLFNTELELTNELMIKILKNLNDIQATS